MLAIINSMVPRGLKGHKIKVKVNVNVGRAELLYIFLYVDALV